MKKNWSLIVVAIALLALPLWGKLGVLFARDQFLRLEDIQVSVIDPEKVTPSVADIDEMQLEAEPGWTLMQTLTSEGRLFLLFGDTVFQDFYSYSYSVVKAQIVSENVFTVKDERPFQMVLYGVDEENILYGKHFSNQEFALHLYNTVRDEDFLLRDFGRLQKRPRICFREGLTSYLLDSQWEVLDTRGRNIEIDIKWKADTQIHLIAPSEDFIYFFVEESPKRFILAYNRSTRATTHLQVSEKINKLTPMDDSMLIERGVQQANYSFGYQDEGKIERIREGQKFDHFCIMSPELVCWVQNNFYEVYNVKEKQVIYSKELTREQLRDLTQEGTLFYIPLLDNLRWVRIIR